MTDNKARMRKIFLGMGVLTLVIAIVLVIVWQINQHAVTASLSFPRQRIVAGCTDNFPPFDLRDKSGDHIGYARDISTEVARELGCAIEYRTSPRWVEVVEWLRNGKVDLIHLIAYSPERDEYFDFTIPHTLVPEVIFVRSERLNIHGLDDLKDKQIGAVRRHITHEKLLKHDGLNIMVFETPREGVEALLDGKVDAFAYPQFVFQYLVQQMGREDEIKIVGEPLGHLRYCMAVREGDHVLLSYLDRAIKRIEASGKRDEIAQRWFGREVFLGLTREEVLSLVGWAVFGLLTASLGGSAYIYVRYRLRKAESVLRHNLIFQQMDDSVILTSLDGKITDWNSGAERMFGYSREEILGRRMDFLLAPEGSTELFEGIIREVQCDGIWSGEIRAVRKDGSQVVCSVKVTALRNEKGEIIAYVSIIRDITERKRVEDALRLSEERFYKAFHSSPYVFVVSRLADGRILEVNDAWENLFGYSREEVLGKSSLSLNLYVNPLDRQRAISLLQKQGFVRNFELEIKRKSGDVRQVSLSAEEIEVNGEPCILSITHDITERKKAEEKTKTSLKEKELMLREIHHRVKNNLQVISSLLRLQSEHTRGKKALQMFKESQDRVKSMALIHEKLYESKDLAHIDFKDYIKDLVNKLFRAYKADAGKIAIRTDVEDVKLGVDAAIPCGLIINELVSNCLKHAFPQDIEGEIKVTLHSINKNEIELKVSDTGVGLPDDFDFRKTKSLGLRLVTILAEDQLKGKIELKRDGGTEFKITFKRGK